LWRRGKWILWRKTYVENQKRSGNRHLTSSQRETICRRPGRRANLKNGLKTLANMTAWTLANLTAWSILRNLTNDDRGRVHGVCNRMEVLVGRLGLMCGPSGPWTGLLTGVAGIRGQAGNEEGGSITRTQAMAASLFFFLEYSSLCSSSIPCCSSLFPNPLPNSCNLATLY
jgi:hypothetical protein